MEKSWSQILNNSHSPIPIPCKHYSGGSMFVDICQTINIFLHQIAIRSIV